LGAHIDRHLRIINSPILQTPFRYPASGSAILSNNFLEEGYNVLGLNAGRLMWD
jgi:hypothetical protein